MGWGGEEIVVGFLLHGSVGWGGAERRLRSDSYYTGQWGGGGEEIAV